MPVNIYRVTPGDQKNEHVGWLCDDDWRLWPQIDALSAWLEQSGARLPAAEYVGFCWRESASAGGPVLESATMRRMADIGMSLYLSEYPGFAAEEGTVVEGASSE